MRPPFARGTPRQGPQSPIAPRASYRASLAALDGYCKATFAGKAFASLDGVRQDHVLTGLENGEIKYPVKNFRFNESPIIMLNNLEALGKTERSIDVESYRSSLIPPMKVRDFTFTSLSDAV